MLCATHPLLSITSEIVYVPDSFVLMINGEPTSATNLLVIPAL